MSTDPELAGARLGDRHDAGRAQAVRVARFHGNRVELAVRAQLAHPACHRADPQCPGAILVQGHDTRVTDRVGTARQRIDRGSGAAVGIEQGQAAADGADPHLVVGSVGERGDLPVAHPLRLMISQLPATRIPTADAAGIGPDPHQPALVLVQRHDEGVPQRLGIRGVMLIMAEPARRAIQQVQAAGGADPEVAGLVFEYRAHIVVCQRAALAWIVAECLHDVAVAIHPVQAAVEGPDPQRAAAILYDA